MSEVVITVKKTACGCRVLPLYPSLRVGDTVRWKNRTGDDIVVFFPHAGILGPRPFNVMVPPGEIDGPSDGASLPPKHGTVAGFRYVVWCQATNDWAIGNSDPEIIVEA